MTDIFDPDYGREVEVDVEDNFIEKGEEVNLREADPTMAKVAIGLGWDATIYDANDLDLDVSLFLLNKDDMTRIDEDFVFYNNLEAVEKCVVHQGDNRSGDGGGDDETVDINLNAIPFDIMRVMIVLSIYRGDERGQTLDKMKNGYIRLYNKDNDREIARYLLSAETQGRSDTGMYVASLDREGPYWFFRAIGEFEHGGLADMATKYGLIIHRS